ncbi:predicted nucleotidyltransferase [Candidatus Vecturithrix granuli]|uniref:Predicted nucleotidyltransferase n=1 Tax=Vecturithrix granuli TaxID=1499967 RepID=A0A081BU42_VECG1|nr:predicted nucleotidyltransferase [Candidatus Vecturithrix granuli]
MKKQIPSEIQIILQETEEQLQKIYSNHLQELILFGSYARGDFHEESDIDLLLLLDQMDDLASERAKYFPVISQLSLKFDTVISVIPYAIHEFHSKKTPFILNVSQEGISL